MNSNFPDQLISRSNQINFPYPPDEDSYRQQPGKLVVGSNNLTLEEVRDLKIDSHGKSQLPDFENYRFSYKKKHDGTYEVEVVLWKKINIECNSTIILTKAEVACLKLNGYGVSYLPEFADSYFDCVPNHDDTYQVTRVLKSELDFPTKKQLNAAAWRCLAMDNEYGISKKIESLIDFQFKCKKKSDNYIVTKVKDSIGVYRYIHIAGSGPNRIIKFRRELKSDYSNDLEALILAKQKSGLEVISAIAADHIYIKGLSENEHISLSTLPRNIQNSIIGQLEENSHYRVKVTTKARQDSCLEEVVRLDLLDGWKEQVELHFEKKLAQLFMEAVSCYGAGLKFSASDQSDSVRWHEFTIAPALLGKLEDDKEEGFTYNPELSYESQASLDIAVEVVRQADRAILLGKTSSKQIITLLNKASTRDISPQQVVLQFSEKHLNKALDKAFKKKAHQEVTHIFKIYQEKLLSLASSVDDPEPFARLLRLDPNNFKFDIRVNSTQEDPKVNFSLLKGTRLSSKFCDLRFQVIKADQEAQTAIKTKIQSVWTEITEQEDLGADLSVFFYDAILNQLGGKNYTEKLRTLLISGSVSNQQIRKKSISKDASSAIKENADKIIEIGIIVGSIIKNLSIETKKLRGELILQIRNSHEMTQKSLAEYYQKTTSDSISTSTISKLEHGKKNINPTLIKGVSTVFRVNSSLFYPGLFSDLGKDT